MFARRYDPGISQILAESATIVAEAQADAVRGDGTFIQELNRRLDPRDPNRLSDCAKIGEGGVGCFLVGWLVGSFDGWWLQGGGGK